MIEIPGEEAATDPGAKAKAEQHAEDVRTWRKSPVVPTFVVCALLLMGIGGYWYSQREEPFVMVETEELYIVPSTEHQAIAMASDPASTGTDATTRPAAGTAHASTSTPPDRGPSTGSSVPDGGGSTTTPVAAVAPIGGTGGSIGIGGLGATVTRKDLDTIVLKEAKDIEVMARRVISGGAPRLQQCYEARLKEDATLRGSWTLSFRVERTGKPTNVKAVGKDKSDAGLEECIVRNVSAWQFVRISEPLDVSKSIRFDPSGM